MNQENNNLYNNQQTDNTMDNNLQSVQATSNVAFNAEPLQNGNSNQQVYKNSNKISIGTIIGIIFGVIILIVATILIVILVSGKSENQNIFNNETISKNKTVTKTNIFYADGYNLEYDDSFSKTSVSTKDGKSGYVLMYGDEEAYLAPISISSLSSLERDYNIDFNTYFGKKKLYNIFYESWNQFNTTKLFGGTGGFSILTGNTYYASMDYGISSNKINGKMYLLVNPYNNVVISLESNISKDFSKNSDRILEVLKTISIYKILANPLSDYLESMTAWDQYSNLRQGKLGTKKDINGGWKTLSSTSAYWVFKNGEFWWYSSENDLNDNYWYGTTRILDGKIGLKEFGLDENKVDSIVANAGEKVSTNNIYTIIFTPKKLIAGGKDKSSTNINGENMRMVWVIVDHGSEGLEAQVLDIDSGDFAYLVKLND